LEEPPTSRGQMFDVQRLLGMMMGTGLGGNNPRLRHVPTGSNVTPGLPGPLGGLLGGLDPSSFMRGAGEAVPGRRAFPNLSGMGGGFTRSAALAALGGLVLKALQNYGTRIGSSNAAQTDHTQAQIDDTEALLLIRAMIAAANADGQIDANEQQRIVVKLDEAGASQEEREFIGREMRNPVALDVLLRDVRGGEQAQRFFVASVLAIKADTPAEQSYLRYLADRLGLEPEQARELTQMLAGASAPAA
jgi:uncharacterized membrane protein YebE (DUF533 family)